MSEEVVLRNIMAIIYRGGHWANQAEKFDEILIYVDEELSKIREQAGNIRTGKGEQF